MKAIILFAATALFSTTLFAQEYEIRLSRPGKAGEKYRLLAKGTYAEGVTVSAAGRVVQQKNNEFSVELISLLTVISTNKAGRLTGFSLAIERFLLTSSGTSKSLVASDQVIFASREGNLTFLR